MTLETKTKKLSKSFPNYLGTAARTKGPAGLGVAATNEFPVDSQERFQVARHTLLLNDAIMEMLSGEGPPRLFITLPPRHGKSWMVSYFLPVYLLGNHPTWSIGLASYSADFAHGWGRKARDLMKRVGPMFYGVNVDKGLSQNKEWGIEGYPGKMLSAGIGGPFTGHGFDVVIVDDPVKNMQDALSPTKRETAWQWFKSVALTRLQGIKGTIVMNTRWHYGDLYGLYLRHCIEHNLSHREIHLPALALQGDLLGRAPGEALWPEFEDTTQEKMEEKRIEVGSYVWSALYQGQPSPDEGGVFKSDWWKYYDAIPETKTQMMSVDANFGETESEADFVVVQVWGRQGKDFYLLDQVRERADFPRSQVMIRTMANKWPRCKRKLVEKKANGAALISTLKKEISGIIGIVPKENKLARAHAMSHFVEAGQVYLPSMAAWTEDFVVECCTFPVGENDDQVDAMTQAINYWATGGGALVPFGGDKGDQRRRRINRFSPD